MKFVKFLVAAGAVAMLSLVAVPSFAQGPRGGGPGGQRPDPVARLNDELHLSQSQQKKIRAIFDDFHSKMQAMRGNPNARQQMQGMFQELRSKIDSVLTPAQKKKFEAMRPMIGGPGGRMMQMMDQLDLTAAQKHKINAILTDMRQKMQAIPEDQRRDKMRPLMEKTRAEIQAVLTPAQRKKFENLMEQGRTGGGPGGPGGRG